MIPYGAGAMAAAIAFYLVTVTLQEYWKYLS